MTSRHPEPESGTAVFRLFPSSAGVAGGRGRRAAGDEGFDPEAIGLVLSAAGLPAAENFDPEAPQSGPDFVAAETVSFLRRKPVPLSGTDAVRRKPPRLSVPLSRSFFPLTAKEFWPIYKITAR
ncbi:MAG: hypothetical protein C6P37_05990 [Caldibacillus debilis]|uniref:Uncharacterized protein n=1 Tax=Caldibacillus debilis TaxID=301148 RepID=A0A3E0K6P7_9BACI|nr:MAG: hypothetical protein C6P37_05990 [Caldibacillus debilis]